MASRLLDDKILGKIAKRIGTKDLNKIRKMIDKKASTLRVSSPVAMVVLAHGYGIGTSSAQKNFSDSQKVEFNRVFAPPPQVSIQPIRSVRRSEQRIRRIEFLSYETEDRFVRGHIDELNLAYTHGCYTSVFILARKIVENLIIDLLKVKYPENIKANKELYFDTSQRRYLDFGIVLKNFRAKRGDFGTENKAVERLCDLAMALKNDANDKAHSWYYLVKNKGEIDKLELGTVVDLIKRLTRWVRIG